MSGSTMRRVYRLSVPLFMLVFFFFAIQHRDLLERLCFYNFQERDLIRGLKLLNGEAIFFGPEMTGGGHLPGPLYYLILALAQAFRPDWFSAWILMIAFGFAGAAIGWRFFRGFSLVAAVTWFTLYSLSPIPRLNWYIFLNVSYLLPLAVLSLFFVQRAFTRDKSDEARGRDFIFANLIVSLGLQFHFSNFSFFISLIFLQIFARHFGLRPVNRRYFVGGMAAFLLPCLPYLIWLALKQFGIEAGQDAGYAGESGKAVLSLIHMFNDVWANGFSELTWQALSPIPTAVPFSAFALLVAVAIDRMVTGEAQLKRAREFTPVIVCALVGCVPFAYWIFVSVGLRYAIPFFVAVTALTVVGFEIWSAPRVLRRYNWCAGVLLAMLVAYFAATPAALGDFLTKVILVSTVFAICLFNAEFRKRGVVSATALGLTLTLASAQNTLFSLGALNSVPRIMTTHKEWGLVWAVVQKSTGWSYDEALRRIFFVNHHFEQASRPSFEQIAGYGLEGRPLTPAPDGFIVSSKRNLIDLEIPEAVSWLLQQNIPAEIKEALKSGDLELGPIMRRNAFILPYRVKSTKLLPRSFHNSGQGYFRGPQDLVLNRVAGQEGTAEVGQGSYVFKWNECPSLHPYCSTGALVELRKDGRRNVLKVQAVGGAISQVSPWISPGWTQSWIEPYVEARCGRQLHHFRIASSIGYNRQYAPDPKHLFLRGNNSFAAPFDREFEFECSERVQEVSLGRTSSQVETIYDLKTLPAKRLTVVIP